MGTALMPRVKTDPCGGCGQKSNAVYPGPLCQRCWDAVLYETKAAYVKAEGTDHYEEARGDLLYEARLAYRMTILLRLWKKTWRKKFKAKYRLEHEAARITAKEEAEAEERPRAAPPERAELVFD